VRRALLSAGFAALLVAATVTTGVAAAHPLPSVGPLDVNDLMHQFDHDRQPAEPIERSGAVPCVDGQAGEFPCENVDLLSVIPLADFDAEAGNDIWGWTDPRGKKNYALMGLDNGTAFVDISRPESPVYLGKLPTRTTASSWRDIKVHADHAFIVSEARGHGMQVFDLTRLRSLSGPPQTLTPDAEYSGFSNAHNIAINEDTGFAYAVGSNTCSGGLHMVNIREPKRPAFAGCVSGDGYTHDTQVVVYDGPDERFTGREIAFSSNEDSLTIVDVTEKAAPVQLARINYAGFAYTHQGWLTPDQRYFVLGDELDETVFQHDTRTYVFDLASLTDSIGPTLNVATYTAQTAAIDHNLYSRGDYLYQANYRAGLRVLDARNVAGADFTEVGFFDVYPEDDEAAFNGAWSNYPYFDDGVVIVSGIEQGLFVLRPNL